MPRRARIALIGAAAGVAMLGATWWLSRYVTPLRAADGSMLSGFEALQRPAVNGLTNFIASLCDPQQYVFLAAVPVLMALLRRRPWLAVVVLLVIFAANGTTQLLKPLLAAPRVPVPGGPTTDASWPSGHATASMSLALCCVIAAPPRWRSWVAAAMAAFTVAVCWSFLELGWHYPSDVLGGFLVATVWALITVAALWTAQARATERSGAGGGRARWLGAARADPAGLRRGDLSVAETVTPSLALAAAALALALAVLAVRPNLVIGYAFDHESLVVGAVAIGTLALTIATGLSVILRRG